MNAPWFYCDGEVAALGAFEAVSALRGRPGGEGSQCRAPQGDPRAPDFRFCDNTARRGSSYCADHSRLCIKPKGSL